MRKEPVRERELFLSVENAIALYRPSSTMCPNFPAYEDACRELLAKVTPSTPRGAVNSFIPLVQMCEWYLGQGFRVDLGKMLRPEHVDRFLLVGMPGLSETSRHTRISHLRRLGKTAAPQWWRATAGKGRYQPRLPPYDAETKRGYFIAARHQSNIGRRRFFLAMLHLGFGAGLKPMEIASARPIDLVVENGYYAIRTASPRDESRTVPIRLEHVDGLLELAAEWPNDRFTGTMSVRAADPLGRAKSYIEIPASLPPLLAARLRHSWMVDILNDGVDLGTFLTISGSNNSRAIAELLPYLTPQTPSRSWAKLTGDTHG